MASEVISHAIFASSHLFPPHLALRSTSRPALRLASRLNCTPHHALHSSPYSAQPFTLRPDPHSHPYPSAKSLLPPIVKPLPPSHSNFFPSTDFPSASLYHSVSLSQVPPADFLVRKKARFTHDMTFSHHDVRGKRFNAHGASHNMEMSSVKTMWQRSPGGGGTSGGMVAHDLVNGWQATA